MPRTLLIFVVVLSACMNDPAVSSGQSTVRAPSDATVQQSLKDYVEQHAQDINAEIARSGFAVDEIVAVESCMGRVARQNGGVPLPSQTLTEINGQWQLVDQQGENASGVVGTCHVEVAGCQSGCGRFAAITIGLLTGSDDQVSLPGSQARLTAAGLLDFDE